MAALIVPLSLAIMPPRDFELLVQIHLSKRVPSLSREDVNRMAVLRRQGWIKFGPGSGCSLIRPITKDTLHGNP